MYAAVPTGPRPCAVNVAELAPDAASTIGQLRDAEVENLDAALFRDEQVLRLDVAVHDPALVCGRETLSDLPRAVERLARRQPPVVHRLPQRLALQQLGDEIGGALERADVVDCEDVGVREAGDGAAPPARTAAAGRDRPRIPAASTLIATSPLQPRIVGAIDRTHPAGPEQLAHV